MDYYRNIDHFCYPKRNTKPMGLSYMRLKDLEEEPVSLEFFKAHARIDFEADDTLSQHYITAARQYLETWTQRSFGVEEWRLQAHWLPEDFHIMYGPIDEVLTGQEIFNDRLKSSINEDVTIDYRTNGIINDTIKVAIARYAAGLYAIRENIFINDKGNPIVADDYIDEAKKMLEPIRIVSEW